MSLFRKALSIFVLITFSVFSTNVFADQAMEHTLRSSLYGGVIGALLGTAVMLLTDDPDDNLSYIPTGAAVGILVGAAYGLTTSTVVKDGAVGEYDDGRFTLKLPTIKRVKVFDKNANHYDVIESVELLRVKF